MFSNQYRITMVLYSLGKCFLTCKDVKNGDNKTAGQTVIRERLVIWTFLSSTLSVECFLTVFGLASLIKKSMWSQLSHDFFTYSTVHLPKKHQRSKAINVYTKIKWNWMIFAIIYKSFILIKNFLTLLTLYFSSINNWYLEWGNQDQLAI